MEVALCIGVVFCFSAHVGVLSFLGLGSVGKCATVSSVGRSLVAIFKFLKTLGCHYLWPSKSESFQGPVDSFTDSVATEDLWMLPRCLTVGRNPCWFWSTETGCVQGGSTGQCARCEQEVERRGSELHSRLIEGRAM